MLRELREAFREFREVYLHGIACLVMMIASLVTVCVEVASGWLIAFVRSFFVFYFYFGVCV